MSTFIKIESDSPPSRHAPPSFALFQLGFRPFYLLAATFAALALPVWIAIYCGWLVWTPQFSPMLWHAHEMIFGFALAVISGFLFTAAKTWTGLATPIGRALVLRVVLWVAARIAFAAGAADAGVLLDLIFIASIALPLAKILIASNNRRNYFVFLLLGAFAAADIVFWLALTQTIDVAHITPLTPIYFASFLVVMLITVIGGRVIPSFTANALPGIWQWRNERVDQAAFVTTAAAFIAFLVSPSGMLTAFVWSIAALLQTIRLVAWNPWATRAKPILWILHIAYAWLPLGLFLGALAAAGVIPPIAAMHALTVGTIGGMIIGMITRTAIGHTGRPMRADTADVAMFILIQFAAVTRVVLPLLWPERSVDFIVLSGACWSAAFALYVVVYLPRLARARVDGKAG